ncbi:hypothetical protein MPER_08040, partial [Moniliophthora perniciosa FA553]
MSAEFSFESIYSIQGVLLGPFVSVGLILFLLESSILAGVIALFALSVIAALFQAGNTFREAALAFHAASTKDTGPLEEWEYIPVNASALVPEAFIQIFYVLANCIADAILLYRCFVVWEFRKRVIIVPLSVIFATNAFGLAESIVYLVALGTDQHALFTPSFMLSAAYTITNAVKTPLLTIMI